jgi:hypothetical protein
MPLHRGYAPGITTGAAVAPDIAFVQASAAIDTGTTTTATVGYTCAVSPGNNRLLVAAITGKQDSDNFDAATYNGVAMTQAVLIRNTTPTPDIIAAIYYLLHADIPNDGVSHNLMVDWNSSTSSSLKGILLEYINVAQGAPHRQPAGHR